MSNLVQNLEVTTYIDDSILLTSKSLKDRLLKLDMVLVRISITRKMYEDSESRFLARQIQYLIYSITKQAYTAAFGMGEATNEMSCIK
jgi:hypothetical protein